MKKRLVVLSGAGMSAESGIPTFRAINGLWENYRVEDVASPSGWQRDPRQVLEFYNQRRKQVIAARPNEGHRLIAQLESYFEVQVITQNIDDLHERAGSTNVMHLHGEIMKSRSTSDSRLIYPVGENGICWGDHCELGSQLRPHIVWFGEEVPLIDSAADLTSMADIIVIVGTSLQVYPAAGLISYAAPTSRKFIIDPAVPDVRHIPNIITIPRGASEGLRQLCALLDLEHDSKI